MKYFERVLERMSFKFIPIFSVVDNSIFGYRIVKDFSTLGFDDKEYMYQMACEKKVFDEFALKMLEKACKEIKDRQLENKYFLYTLRFNFIEDPITFFKKLNLLIKDFQIKEDSFIFDVKGIKNWENFHNDYSKIFKYKIILKEEKNSSFNIATLEKSKADFMEPRTIDTLAFMKKNINLQLPLIFNLSCDNELNIDFLKSLGVDYYYNLIRK
ncbi:hypothetical protein [uncultured Fusobacterium sp.]|uniref:hypothetical protein n=1 Tax=uncultured Fusobacterium sp. TaxID=159267 RepID=UPI0025F651D6|nr:hypothetical protein [uncultured Fusobacterium sp.]